MINYPVDVDTPEKKLHWCMKAKKKLIDEHNQQGVSYKNWLTVQNEYKNWSDFLANTFEPKLKVLSDEISLLAGQVVQNELHDPDPALGS